MLLKKRFEHSTGEPILTHVEVIRKSKKQNFTRKFIDKSVESGLMTLTKGSIVLHTVPELTYKIIRGPGIFCCFDNERISDQEEARAYVAKNFKGVPSPDSNNPSGYRDDRFYACQLIKEEKV